MVVGGQTSFIISFSPTSKHQMSKRACPTPCNTPNKKRCTLKRSYAFYCPHGYEKHFDLYKHEHRMMWSRIEPTFGIGEDEHGAYEFNVEIGVYDGYRLCEENKHTFKMADWAVHTNYPRNPFDFEDF